MCSVPESYRTLSWWRRLGLSVKGVWFRGRGGAHVSAAYNTCPLASPPSGQQAAVNSDWEEAARPLRRFCEMAPWGESEQLPLHGPQFSSNRK